MKLTINSFDEQVRRFCAGLAAGVSPDEFERVVDALAELRVLVVGDVIFDRYSCVKVQGLTSKNQIISGRFIDEETQCGGALAVFRHVRQFTPNVRLLGMVGSEPWVDDLLRPVVAPAEDLLLREPGVTTIIKQRFVEPLSPGKELSKLFAVNYIDARPPAQEAQSRFLRRLSEEIANCDLLMVLDFGHGLMQADQRELVQHKAPFLALNCQTNSNNHGFNIISRQYRRADAFSLDQLELMLSCGHRHIDFGVELGALRASFDSQYAWLTRGPVETIGLRGADQQSLIPPLETDVVDTIGAGDAFFSVAMLAAAKGYPIDLATFLGQLAGAQAVKIVGNSESVSKPLLIETGKRLLANGR